VSALPAGFTASGVAAGLKPSGKPDLGLLVSDRPATAVGIFTTNRVKAAPVQLTQRLVRRGSARAIVVNAGNANACTGRQGLADAKAMGAAAGKSIGVHPKDVLVASTGVIGVPMPMEPAIAGIGSAAASLSADGLGDLARAIMTTDTVPKTAGAEGAGYRIAGLAKGAGMIAPEMATMLCFVATDATVTKGALHDALAGGGRVTFDRISVDGCRSTNDCVLVLANGAAGGDPIEPQTPEAAAFAAELRAVLSSLAAQIVADGEGATKVATITVRGATKEREAMAAARAIADSVLLRCAIGGGDPNWGRVMAALGTAPIPFDPNRVDVFVGGEKLCEQGARGPGDLTLAAKHLAENREVSIAVDLHRGEAEASMLTNDLTAEYVRINTEYTT